MNQHPSDAVAAAILQLEADENEMLHRAAAMVGAYNGAFFSFDLLANAAVNRFLALSSGFRTLIREKNFICAGAILRLHLDTAARFSAGFIVANPHEFARQVFEGTPIRKMKDQLGNVMNDKYLVGLLAKEEPWIQSVYDKTSGYIHFSETHIASTFHRVNEADRSAGIKISAVDKDLPDSIYLEAIEAFRAITKVFVRYVDGWTITKANTSNEAALRAARERGELS